MCLTKYAGMIFPGRDSLINKINISITNRILSKNKFVKFKSRQINQNFPIIENQQIFKNYNIFFETIKRPRLKIKFDKINQKLLRRIKNIKKNLIILGASSGIGNDCLNLFKFNKKIKIFASYNKNKINSKNKNIKIIKFDINKDLKKIIRLIKLNSPISIYYFVTNKINNKNDLFTKKKYKEFYIDFPLRILRELRNFDINFLYPSTSFISEKPNLLYSKIKLEAEKKLRKYKNVSIIRFPEINTKQNLGIMERNLKNLRFYLNNNQILRNKFFFNN